MIKENTEDLFEQAEKFWNHILQDEITFNTLYEKDKGEHSYIKEEFTLDCDTRFMIEKISKGNDIAIYMIILAVYEILLYRFTDQNNNIVVSPVIKNNSSTYNKFVLFRQEVTSKDTFREILEQVKNQVSEGYKNQFYPLLRVIEKKDENYVNGLFNFALIYSNIHNYDDIEPLLTQFKNNILLSFIREEGLFRFCLKYKEGVMNQTEAQRFLHAFKTIIEQVVNAADTRIAGIEIMSADEKDRILNEFNNTNIKWNNETNIINEFEYRANENPDKCCLTFIIKKKSEFEYSYLSYRQVNDKANQVGRFLRDHGVEKNDIVALVMKSSIDMYIGILGVLKAGAAYLPLSDKYPMDRIQYSIQDCGCKCTLTNVEDFELENNQSKMLHMNQSIYSEYSTDNLNIKVSDTDAAYVIYTSGTTGNPKGVLIDQGNIMNTLLFRKKMHYLTSDDVILQLNTYVFDGFVATFFTPLIAGANIIAMEEENITDIETLKEAILTNEVTHFASIPMLYKEIVDNISSNEFSSVKSVVLAGDKVRYDIICDSKKKFTSTKIVIEYGVSECSVLSTYLECNHDIQDRYFIGRPIDNHKVYVLNRHELLQPMGAVGELCISGVGVSNKGYLNQSRLNREKFINNPFQDNQLLYKTGDLVRWLPEGVLEYIGRKDNQVKIRGYRIELAEIEKQLLRHPAMQNVIVVTKKINTDQYICVYYKLEDSYSDLDERDLKHFLKGQLPKYMIPSFFCKISYVPLTSNNKINYSKLPEISFNKRLSDNVLTTDIEKKLAAIWAELLDIDTNLIGNDTNFFDFGGHSLNVTKMLARIYKTFGVNISVSEIYQNSEFEHIVNMINESNDKESIQISKVDEKEFYTVSSAQKRMYFLHELDQTKLAYNICSIKKIENHLNLKKMEQTFKEIIRYREALRTSFHNIEGEIVQKIHDFCEVGFSVNIIDGKEMIEEQLASMKHPFDLSVPGLFHVDFVHCTDELGYLIINIHHIIADGYSVKLILDDFNKAYHGEELQEVELTYKDYAQWQIDYNVELVKEKNYWVERFKGEIPTLNLPTDYIRPNNKSFKGNVEKFSVDTSIVNRLKEIADENNVSVFILILAVYNVFLNKLTGSNDIVVGIPTLGRKYVELQNMIGMFSNTLPMRNNVNHKKSFLDLLQEVKENSTKDLDHEDFQYENIINSLMIDRKINRNPLFDTMLNFEDIDMPVLEMEGVKISDYEYIRDTAKFDLTCNCLNIQKDMTFEFEYDVQLFKKETIHQYIVYMKNIICEICENANKPIWDICMLPKEEYDFIHNCYNATDRKYPSEKTIIDLFEEQVTLRPDKIAINLDDKTITYKELSYRSNALANKLCEEGVMKGDIIGIKIDKSFELIIAILAVLKTGSTYVPMGNEYNSSKINHVIDSSKLRVVLTDHKMCQTEKFMGDSVRLTVFVDEFIDKEMNQYSNEYKSKCSPDDNAYIIYTSGSTGIPKGVEITNKNLVNYVDWAKENYIDDTVKDFAFFTSVSFDLTVTSIFTPLISGNTIVIYNENDVIQNLTRIINEKKVQIIKLTPSHLKFMINLNGKESTIKRIIVGGENLIGKHAQRIWEMFNHEVDIVNEYGPTEATVGCMIYHYCSDIDWDRVAVPIGKPAANTKIYLLDQSHNIVPKGLKGEMYISGDSVAKGYINNSKLTDEKFVDNPFIPGTVMYKTGDIAVMNDEGDLIFVERNDRQVKLNGYRIELNEIENTLLKMNGVSDVVATVCEIKGVEYLLAFVTSVDKEVTESKLKGYSESKLPQYMIADRYVILDEIPINKSGKQDVEYLQKKYSDFIYLHNEQEILEKGSNEEKILHVWKSVLNKDGIDINDNFFEAGGDSLIALKMKAGLEETFKVDISITFVFEFPTIRLMSKYFSDYDSVAATQEEDEYVHEVDEGISFMKQNLNKFTGD